MGVDAKAHATDLVTEIRGRGIDVEPLIGRTTRNVNQINSQCFPAGADSFP